MKLSMIILLALSSLAGCGEDACEAAVASMQSKAEECGLLDSTSEIDDANSDGTGRECSAEDEAALSRQAQCMQNASCQALGGIDVAGNEAFAACVRGQ